MGWEFSNYRLPYRHQRGTLGTFAGVFTPSILTIIGIILFLRLGYVVGSAGLGQALLIILLANLISVLTSLSLAAISTSLNVKGGGIYYLISRTLGGEFGGAIGIVLFLAQSVSIGFYCIGFGEAVQAAKPQGFEASPQIIAAAEKEARKAAKEAVKAAEIAQEKQRAWEEAREKGENQDKLREMEEAAREAGELAQKAALEAATTRTGVEAAAKSAEAAKKEANQK